ncbi:DM9 repeat-containing protein [Henriciella litoralis]|uniref:DM9 repeat-containing protein n=1 Tax=Henriciella litoralis TaxID=568102 RepID=UPI00111C13FA|nr:DM9 repeat-containing protein [Henriciella litoralis]
MADAGWTDFEGTIPDDAISGGLENEHALPVCRVEIEGKMHPGKVHVFMCHFAFDGAEYLSDEFEVLTKAESDIEVWSALAVTDEADVVRSDNNTDETLQFPVCRAAWKDGLHPGKLEGAKCHFGYGGRELVAETYEVLQLVASE